MRILDIGCGRQKEAGAIGLDMNPSTDADVLADVSSSPLPIRPQSVDRIFIRHIIEHVNSPLRFMEELHAAARDGAEIEGITPHFSNPCSFADPTHKHHFSLMFLNFFSGEGESASSGWRLWANRFLECYYPPIPFYTRARFEIIERRITFCRLHRWLGVACWPTGFRKSGNFISRDSSERGILSSGCVSENKRLGRRPLFEFTRFGGVHTIRKPEPI